MLLQSFSALYAKDIKKNCILIFDSLLHITPVGDTDPRVTSIGNADPRVIPVGDADPTRRDSMGFRFSAPRNSCGRCPPRNSCRRCRRYRPT